MSFHLFGVVATDHFCVVDETQNGTNTVANCLKVPKNMKIELACDPAIAFWVVY